jgi:hypothetical protein
VRRRSLLRARKNFHGANVRQESTDICIEAELYLRLIGEPYLLRFRRTSTSLLFLIFIHYHKSITRKVAESGRQTWMPRTVSR